MMRPRLLDLFCGAGGCSVGYERAGFEVVGVDIEPHPDYPFHFIQGDALVALRDDGWLATFDAIHASPPCQGFSTMKVMQNARVHADLLTPTRERLVEVGLPYVIENVPGAPIRVGPPSLLDETWGVVLCGTMFDLNNGEHELRRHRLFESNVPLSQPDCDHRLPVIGFYGDHARTRQRTVNGHRDRGGDIVGNDRKMPLVRDLLGIDWMKWEDATQAIPPAYTEFVGAQLLAHIEAVQAA